MTYGKRLEKSLLAANKTRKELAAALECKVQAIGMVITGAGKAERSLSGKNNVKAAKFLKVDSYWLATGAGDPKPKYSEQQKEISTLSADAIEIGVYFDKLTDPGDRTMAYVAAMAEILKVLAERQAVSAAAATDTPAASESPKKQRA